MDAGELAAGAAGSWWPAGGGGQPSPLPGGVGEWREGLALLSCRRALRASRRLDVAHQTSTMKKVISAPRAAMMVKSFE